MSSSLVVVDDTAVLSLTSLAGAWSCLSEPGNIVVSYLSSYLFMAWVVHQRHEHFLRID